MQTTYEILRQRAQTAGDHPLFRYRSEKGWKTITTGECIERIARIAGRLAERGVGPGDRVAIISDNRWEWLAVDLALRHLNAATVGLYPTDTRSNWCEILRKADCKVIFLSGSLVREYSPIQSEAGIPHVVGFDGKSFEMPAMEPFEVYLSGPAIPASNAGPDDLATLIFTSGTTGTPKGAMLTHRNHTSNAQSAIVRFGIGMTDHYVSFLPICHAFERTALNAMMRAGACVWFGHGVTTLLADFSEARPTIICSVPRVVEKVHARIMNTARRATPVRRALFGHARRLCKKRFSRIVEGKSVPPWLELAYWISRKAIFGRVHRLFGNRLRYIVAGGAAMPPHVSEFFFSIGIPCLEGYGITECSPIVAANCESKMRIGTVGEVFPDIEVKLSDENEILVRGPCVMTGYWRDVEATRQAIDSEGWFHTGDLGTVDEAGFLAIRDRKKEILVTSGGKNISPVRIETLAMESPYIAQCCVCADGRHYVSALIVPNYETFEGWFRERSETSPAREDLSEHSGVRAVLQAEIKRINEGLARYESIRGFIVLSEEFQIQNGLLTPTLKMRRRAIEALYKPQLDRLYNANPMPQ